MHPIAINSVALILAVVAGSICPARAFITSPARTAAPSFVAKQPKDTNRYMSRTQSHVLAMSSMSNEGNLKLDPTKTAVVLIEYQNEFATEGGKLHDAVKEVMVATNMLANSKKLMDECRAAGCQIVHIPISFEKGHKEISPNPYGILAGVKEGEAFSAGEWGAEFCDTMKPLEGDIIVKGKNGLCGFKSTNLDFVLRQNNIDNIVLGGFLTNCCVESTMRTAYENGYKVYTLKDCCAATSMAGQEAAFEHTFGMFSVPITSATAMDAVKTPVSA